MKVVTRYFCVPLLLLCFSANAQIQFSGIDVLHYTFRIGLNDQNDTIKGQAMVDIKFVTGVKTFQLNLVGPDAKGKGMLISSITEGAKSLSFSQDSDAVNISSKAKGGSLPGVYVSSSQQAADLVTFAFPFSAPPLMS